MVHTAGGPPLMGHVQIGATGLILYAPAQVSMPTAQNVLYQPFPFERKAIELMWAGIRARNVQIDDVVVRAYAGFVDAFIEGAYRMKPVVLRMSEETEGTEEGAADTAEAPPKAANDSVLAPMQVCPACSMEVSNWRAHYPVLVDNAKGGGTESPPPPLADMASFDAGVSSVQWICEVTQVGGEDIRQAYPDYTPPTPHPSLTTAKSSVQ